MATVLEFMALHCVHSTSQMKMANNLRKPTNSDWFLRIFFILSVWLNQTNSVSLKYVPHPALKLSWKCQTAWVRVPRHKQMEAIERVMRKQAQSPWSTTGHHWGSSGPGSKGYPPRLPEVRLHFSCVSGLGWQLRSQANSPPCCWWALRSLCRRQRMQTTQLADRLLPLPPGLGNQLFPCFLLSSPPHPLPTVTTQQASSDTRRPPATETYSVAHSFFYPATPGEY